MAWTEFALCFRQIFGVGRERVGLGQYNLLMLAMDDAATLPRPQEAAHRVERRPVNSAMSCRHPATMPLICACAKTHRNN